MTPWPDPGPDPLRDIAIGALNGAAVDWTGRGPTYAALRLTRPGRLVPLGQAAGWLLQLSAIAAALIAVAFGAPTWAALAPALLPGPISIAANLAAARLVARRRPNARGPSA